MTNLTQTQWEEQLLAETAAVVLDVRTPEEYATGSLENANNVDYLDEDFFVSEMEKADKSITYYVYCRSGARSANACMLLEQMGFETVYNLRGGINNWTGKIINNV
jgi:rhodanese-related sulfurtransferase